MLSATVGATALAGGDAAAECVIDGAAAVDGLQSIGGAESERERFTMQNGDGTSSCTAHRTAHWTSLVMQRRATQ